MNEREEELNNLKIDRREELRKIIDKFNKGNIENEGQVEAKTFSLEGYVKMEEFDQLRD